ncbi:glycosyltransferase involved in cell wall biosynthesis [Salegentibacter sp. 24]|uniref:glycosyltransferase family 2 protein n=1 Tax=Salegentibacter sp. 24 TaxID=2183986 RepID=UPI0010F2F562|nr:glycosyltransferase family 2 protein [Salegentibacter sp. 24]TDN82184.1 glycosyltransferase involved in cell wall biosynthesis [Salegentibacter sp. 24]
MEILISIIIPTYNRANLLLSTLESVLNQTYEHVEIIIVDDGSTDDTAEIIKPFLKNKCIVYTTRPKEKRGGGNAARNYGYEISRGKYIKWLDSDDVLLPDCLEKQLYIIEQDETDVVFGRSRWFKNDPITGEILQGKLWHDGIANGSTLLEDFVMGKSRFSNNDGLWRKSILQEKPYHENLRNSQEYLMIIKMLARNVKVSLIDDILVLVRSHENQMADNRKYSLYVKNQILARYYVLKILKDENVQSRKISKYLVKSNFYYLLNQIAKRDFDNFPYNLKIFFKTLNVI